MTTTTKTPVPKAPAERFNVYQMVTDALIKSMEEGHNPWASPYLVRGSHPLSMSTNRPYRGINPFLLSFAQAAYTSPWWGTYKRIAELGGQVRKGEHSSIVTFWKRIVKEEWDQQQGKIVKRNIFLLRYYRVFNADQADGLPEKYYSKPREVADPCDEAEALISAYLEHEPGLEIRSERQDVAYYHPVLDYISVPHRGNIVSDDAYYSTIFHEMTHSTGHGSRLAREGIVDLTPHNRGDLYSAEELVAEMGAAICCAMVGLSSADEISNSAAYLRGWISKLRGDSKLAVRAASKAQAAVDRILGISYSDTDGDGES